MPPPTPHRIGRIAFEAQVADADLAMALRPRLDDIAFRLAPAVIERALDRLDLGEAHLRLDRLDLDLGTLDADSLETDAAAALEAALSEALTSALHAARHDAAAEARLVAPHARRLERFEYFLMNGRLPPPGRDAGFSATETLIALARDDPRGLVAMLRRRARERPVLERLALQAGEEALRILLGALAPADAAAILLLMEDVVLAHRAREVAALARLAEPALRRLIWIATLEFLLRDAGSQFNRRRFLEHLLRREAEDAGVDYEDLLALLATAVASAATHGGLRSSLPAVLADLLSEASAHDAALAPDARTPPQAVDPLEAARAGDFAPLMALVRRRSRDRDALETLARQLTPALFAGLIQRLEPAHAEAIMAAVGVLARVHQAEPISDLAADAFETMLWVLTLRFLLNDAGSQFNRRRFLAWLLHEEARRAGLEDAVLLNALAEALHRLRRRMGLHASLPVTLAELLDDLPALALAAEAPAAPPNELEVLLGQLRAQAPHEARFAAIVRLLPDRAFEGLVHRLAPDGAAAMVEALRDLAGLHADAPLDNLSEAAFEATLRVLTLRALIGDPRRPPAVWLEQLLRALAHSLGQPFEALLATVAASTTGRRLAAPAWVQLLAGYANTPPAALDGDAVEAVAMLRTAAARPGHLLRIAERASAERRLALLAALDPANAGTIAADLKSFAALYGQGSSPAIGADRLAALLWSLAAAHLAGRGAARFDRRALARALLDGVSRYLGASRELVAAELRAGQGRVDAADAGGVQALLAALPPADARPSEADTRRAAIERLLHTGQSAEAGPDLAWAAREEPAWLAGVLRRLGHEAPALEPVLLERLLAWVTPEEALAMLAAPKLARDLLRADGVGAGDLAAWRPIFAALLKGETPPVPAALEPSDRPVDRLARLARWIDGDKGAFPGDLAADLARLTHAELVWLLLDPDGDRTAQRLKRVLAALSDQQREVLADRLAPGLRAPDSAVAQALAEASASARIPILARALAASLAGSEVKAADLTAPIVSVAAATPTPATPEAAKVDAGRLLAWLGGADAPPAQTDGLVRRLIELADAGDVRLSIFLKARLGDAGLRARWAVLLPAPAFARLLAIFTPGHAQAALEAAMLVETAARRTASFGAPRADPARLRALVLDAVAAGGVFRLDDLVRRLVAEIARDARRAEALRVQALALARDGGHLAAVAALRRTAPKPAAKPAKPKPAKPAPKAELPPEPDHALFVGNAGLVLLGPFLPALFERLGVLQAGEDGKPRIDGLEATSLAVHLLQYMADGRLDAPEPELLLNKLLCGLPTAQPVEPSIAPPAAALETCDDLLKHVIASWTIIRNTSIAGLRETFLQREGRLTRHDDDWSLQVQRRTLDVLVDQVPWSFGLIYHRWMPAPLHVKW